jgi:tryptophan synthase alpha chain
MNSSPLAAVFAALRQRGQLAFIPYQTAGFPTLADSLANLDRLAELGADVLELGIPFSDPMADGPTVQYTSQVALQQGVTLEAIIAALKQRNRGHEVGAGVPGSNSGAGAPARPSGGPLCPPTPGEVPAAIRERPGRSPAATCPIVMMSYVNVLMAYGRERLLADLPAAGVHGLIIPDLPHDEAEEWLAAARRHGVAIIFLVAPTSTDDRIREAAERSDAFLYAVSLTGTTGARDRLPEGLPTFLQRIRGVTDKPVVVGFGISKPEHVRELRGQADGVIVASRLLDAIRKQEDWARIARELQAATR